MFHKKDARLIGAVMRENQSSGFLTRFGTNRAAQSLNMARDLKFQIYEEEILNYSCSENKDPDQLCGLPEADLRLCFCHRFSQNAAYMG